MLVGRRAVLIAPSSAIEVWTEPVNPPAGGEVLVEVEMSGVCGTDHHFVLGEVDLPGPMVLGHEGIGRIVEIGGDLRTDSAGEPIAPGDCVYWVPLKPCHRCYACTVIEDSSLCPHQSPGRFRDPHKTPFATYTDYALLPYGMTFFRVPEETPPEAVIAFGCALPTMLHAMERLGSIGHAESVVVQGSGPVGLAAVMLARLAGAGEITVIGAPSARLDMAKRLGATRTVNIQLMREPEERVESVLAATRGRGADVVVEAAGKLEAFDEGLQLVAPGGRYLIVGLWSAPGEVGLQPRHLNNRNLRIIGSALSRPRHIHQAVEIARRHHERLPLVEVVSHRFGLNRSQEAIECVARTEAIKAVIQPSLDKP